MAAAVVTAVVDVTAVVTAEDAMAAATAVWRMAFMVVATATPRVDAVMANAGFAVTSGGLLLVGMGLLHLGVTDHILRVTIGLMTVLAGFEVLYATVEGSILVAALLALINLGLALAGSYLLIASNAQAEEPA
jgi:hypothetical protein